MHSLRLKIPPAVTTVVIGLVMGLGAQTAPALAWRFPGQAVVAMGLVALGVMVALLAVLTFRHARTTINPRQPAAATSLVTHGVFRLSRNPMYLGMAFVLSGWGLWLGHFVALAVAALYVPLMQQLQIIPEEKIMTAKFGAEYTAYQKRVRRWL